MKTRIVCLLCVVGALLSGCGTWNGTGAAYRDRDASDVVIDAVYRHHNEQLRNLGQIR